VNGRLSNPPGAAALPRKPSIAGAKSAEPQVFDAAVSHDIAQPIRVPSATAQNCLPTQRVGIAGRLRVHGYCNW
jgi:hypothetical protein